MSSQFLSLSPVTPAEKEKDETIKKDRPYKIFFKDLFLFKENEMAAKKREKFLNRNMKVYQKSTFSSRMKNRSHLGQIAIFADTGGASVERLGLDPTLVLRLTEGADTKRTIHEFINDQRDRFMLEFTLSTKRNTIQRFEKHTAMKERQLMKAERKLEEDAIAFEEFLRENDQRSVDALKMFVSPPPQLAKSLFTPFFLLFSFSEHSPTQNRLTNLFLFSAAQETINKLQMTAELKKASLEIQSVKSEIAKTEFLLREYMKYGFFLLKLSPKQWQIQQAIKRVSRSKENVNVVLPSIITKLSARRRETIDESRRTSFSEDSSLGRGSQARSRRRTTPKPEEEKSSLSNQTESVSSEDSLEFFLDDDMDYDLEPELYFKEPEELLQVLTELEEQNLTLVQYSQDVDENLEDVNKREKVIQDKINTNIEFLLEHKELLKANCVREEEKAAELELRSRLFSFGEYNSDAQEKLIDSLSKKINQVYKVCIGDAEVGSLNPVQKLVKVESRLVELSDLIDSVPKENVEAIERMKQKERRQRLREEKMREKQKHQEERLKAALERAVAQPKKKKGRQLIYRSKPPSGNKHELLLVKDTRTKSLEEEYFFT
ncbi:LOW QUALITY PROTEIN: coiled-coil domain-containing protein 38 [Moschus berezovskii]|uniref:LOW QUALITY PROTEIN: coiled-coil domain-containing protein 38 n=1 Tax=Moschus berezovskii TaxID=68408 RepID=UPI002444ED4A|nr:LOW QUALITY PROTEIN: coiled-coil domain-containing protein 38 [Moschus berezovskii]